MDTSPLRIGYCLSLSGALASNGKTARLAHQIWQENVNTDGKLLGRPVELVCLDDQTNPKLVADLWARPRVLTVQFQNIESNNISEFKRPNTQAVVDPTLTPSDRLI